MKSLVHYIHTTHLSGLNPNSAKIQRKALKDSLHTINNARKTNQRGNLPEKSFESRFSCTYGYMTWENSRNHDNDKGFSLRSS